MAVCIYIEGVDINPAYSDSGRAGAPPINRVSRIAAPDPDTLRVLESVGVRGPRPPLSASGRSLLNGLSPEISQKFEKLASL